MRFFCIAAISTIVAGCGESPPEFGQVTGVVRVKGRPQSRLMVRFLPEPVDGKELAANASGTTDDQGKYELRYYYKGEEGLGAPVGWNRVLLEDTRLSALAQGQRAPPQIIPPEYNSPGTTPLRKEVKPGPQTIDLEL